MKDEQSAWRFLGNRGGHLHGYCKFAIVLTSGMKAAPHCLLPFYIVAAGVGKWFITSSSILALNRLFFHVFGFLYLSPRRLHSLKFKTVERLRMAL